MKVLIEALEVLFLTWSPLEASTLNSSFCSTTLLYSDELPFTVTGVQCGHSASMCEYAHVHLGEPLPCGELVGFG